jgi:hypothetical protein
MRGVDPCIGCPLTYGRGADYLSSAITSAELFAEAVSEKANSPESLKQLRRIFPNPVEAAEELIQYAIEGMRGKCNVKKLSKRTRKNLAVSRLFL